MYSGMHARMYSYTYVQHTYMYVRMHIRSRVYIRTHACLLECMYGNYTIMNVCIFAWMYDPQPRLVL